MMVRLLINRKISKSYFLLVPLGLYMCVMYRMLESTCFDNTKNQLDGGGMYVPSETKTRKIMQFRFRNNTKLLKHLAEEYELMERQRAFLVQRIQNALRASDSSQDFSDLSDTLLFQPNLNFPSHEPMKRSTYRPPAPAQSLEVKKPLYAFNCTNTYRIKLVRKVGHGVSKQTFQGDFNGQAVAVKMVTRHQVEVKACLEKLPPEDINKEGPRSRCFVFSTMKLMKEILLLEQLDHPVFTRLLGYCIRSEESETSDLSERGIVSVFELGKRFVSTTLQILTWRERLKHAISLSDFLNYLEHSPLGSLRVRDFKEGHFLMVNGTIKMIDLDDVDNLEPSCNYYVNSDLGAGSQVDSQGHVVIGCEFNLSCQRGLCIGFNAKQNMKYMNRLFFKRLLYPNVFPSNIMTEIGLLNVAIDNLEVSAGELHERLTYLQEKGS